MRHSLPFGVKFIALLHLFLAVGYVGLLFTDIPAELSDEFTGFFAAICLVTLFFAGVHAAVGVGLFKVKRLALLGAIVLASFNVFPSILGLLVSLPLGFFGDIALFLFPSLLFYGSILGYLSLNRDVRAAFR